MFAAEPGQLKVLGESQIPIIDAGAGDRILPQVPNIPGSLSARSCGMVICPRFAGSNQPGVGPNSGSSIVLFFTRSLPSGLHSTFPPTPLDIPAMPHVVVMGGPLLNVVIPLSCHPPTAERTKPLLAWVKKGIA